MRQLGARPVTRRGRVRRHWAAAARRRGLTLCLAATLPLAACGGEDAAVNGGDTLQESAPAELAPGVDSIAPAEALRREGAPLEVAPWRRTSSLGMQWAFSYPSGLVQRTEGSDSSAHQLFTSEDGQVTLRTDVDSLGAAPPLEQAYAERSQELLAGGSGALRFGQVEANGYILSGQTAEGRLFAEITLFADGLRKRMHLEYDPSLEMRMLPVAYRVLRSVRG